MTPTLPPKFVEEEHSFVTQPNLPTGAFGRTGLLFDTTCDVILDEIKTIAHEEVTPWGLESDYWMIEEIDMEVEESVAASEMSGVGRFSGARLLRDEYPRGWCRRRRHHRN